MRSCRYTLCDVFTDRPLTGNALAVFMDATGLDTETMQAIAREMNLSETVFVLPPEEQGHFRLRIFTPRRELPFAGHPTLGAALVVGRSVQLESLVLETGRGHVQVTVERQGEAPVFGWMAQPIPTVVPFEHRSSLLVALGLERSVLPIELYDNGIRHVLVAVESKAMVENLTPDLGRLGSLPVDCTSVFAGQGEDWKTRVFAPGVGVPEDPATGSAAGPLALHLLRHGALASGVELRIEQGTEIARPSRLHVRLRGDPAKIERIEVGGHVVVLGRGELRLP